MIAKLRGRLDSAGEDWAVIDAAGVGYQVACTRRTLASLAGAGGEVEVHVHTLMRDSAIQLYGFADAAEQSWFQALLTVQGVGAKTALGVLDALPPAELERALVTEDAAAVAAAEGVGRKGAARIVAELRDRVGAMPAAAPAGEADGTWRDALDALVALGYGRTEALDALSAATGAEGAGGRGAPELVRLALRQLAR